MTEKAPDGGTATAGRLYRIVWRWRFHAGLIGLPEAAPPAPSPGAVSAFAGLALAPGLLSPLLGLSILAVLALDRLAPAALKLKYEL